MILFEDHPLGRTITDLLQHGKGLEVSNNYLQVDSCRSRVSLANGDGFFTIDPQDSPGVDVNCAAPADPPVGWQKNATHTAPYFILIEDSDFNSTIVDMCTTHRDVLVGSTSLNTVWHPQSSGCDQYMTTLCASSNIASTEFKEVCSCFSQQFALDQKFGTDQHVSVCCFGEDDSGDINRSCAFNTGAYKTNAMLEGCCSFAQCTQASTKLKNPTEQDGVTCHGNLCRVSKNSNGSKCGPTTR